MQIVRLDMRYTESQCGEIIDDTQPPEAELTLERRPGELPGRIRELDEIGTGWPGHGKANGRDITDRHAAQIATNRRRDIRMRCCGDGALRRQRVRRRIMQREARMGPTDIGDQLQRCAHRFAAPSSALFTARRRTIVSKQQETGLFIAGMGSILT